jgi:hypothetical protein
MKKIFFLLLVMAALVSCASTRDGNPAGADNIQVIPYNHRLNKIVFDNYRFSFEFHLSQLGGDGAAQRAVKKLVYGDNDLEAYAAYKENLLAEKADKNDFPSILENGKEYVYESEYSETIEIVHFDDSFVILRQDEYSYYSGQAHGASQTKYYILDVQEEQILDIGEITNPLPEDLLKANIKSKHDIDFDFREKVWPPDTVSFGNEGLLLLWNVYSIAPYSEGAIEISLPYSSGVGAYLTKKGISIKESLGK